MAKTGTVAGKQATNEGVNQISLQIPMADPQKGTYIAIQSGRIDASLGHNGKATTAFRRLHAGLLATHATFEDGRPVSSKADVIRWLFLRLAGAESASA